VPCRQSCFKSSDPATATQDQRQASFDNVLLVLSQGEEVEDYRIDFASLVRSPCIPSLAASNGFHQHHGPISQLQYLHPQIAPFSLASRPHQRSVFAQLSSYHDHQHNLLKYLYCTRQPLTPLAFLLFICNLSHLAVWLISFNLLRTSGTAKVFILQIVNTPMAYFFTMFPSLTPTLSYYCSSSSPVESIS